MSCTGQGMDTCDILKVKKSILTVWMVYKHYWHDLRKEPKQWFSQQIGGESAMTWGAFNHHGLCNIHWILGHMDSAQHQAIFYDHLIPFGLFFR